MSNQLQHAHSPYLRQHAANPVHWHAWDAPALQRARDEGKPILLSIGYSACHWCHVMAHECFENDAIAALMNEHFINIKVDREERPDLDKVYQLAQQVLTQHAGGWPLTMFLSHDTHTPFFGGTYFPPEARHGLPGFANLLPRIAQYYREHRNDIEQTRHALLQVFNDLQPVPNQQVQLDATPLQQARAHLQTRFDTEFGGFGAAPKFPVARQLEFLLERWHASSGAEQPDLHALYMSALTLTRMAEGGMNDQLGGGFYRYSVDRYWMIPHFEKMLYDNAELLRVYAQALLASGEPLFQQAVRTTAQWLLSSMRSPQGGFYSALDADSAGHEGAYYVWTREQVAAALTTDEYAICTLRFGLDQPANFDGQWHLHVYAGIDAIAKQLQMTVADVEHELQHARQKLLSVRQARLAPALDDKVLTSWNALTVAALAQAGRSLQDPELLQAAGTAMDHLQQAWRAGRLYAVQAQQQLYVSAYLDDHAYLLAACLEMLQSRWCDADLRLAVQLAEQLLKHFMDGERGGFYFTADDHEQLIHRSKSFADEAMPAGNAIAAQALLRLGYLLAENRYLHAAEQCLRAAWPALLEHPAAHASLLLALQEHLQAPQIIIIRGEQEASEWQQALNKLYHPHRLVLAIPANAVLPDALAGKRVLANTVAYVCQGLSCSEPLQSLPALIALAR